MALFDLFAIGPGWGDELASGFVVTVELSVMGYLLGTALGLAAALGEISRYRTISVALQTYALTIRSVPELLIIFLLYYGGASALNAALSPFDVPKIEINAFVAGLVALTLIHGAYASEVFRGAINAVPTGVTEAARSLGMPPWVIGVKVTLPLAFRYALPGLVNLWMVLIKTTALVSAIGVNDFVRVASTAGQNTKHYFAFYVAVLFAYLVLSGATMLLQAAASQRLFRHLHGTRS